MQPMTLEIGDVVQLNPETVTNKGFAACFMTVTDPKPWGAQGFVQMIGSKGESGGQAFVRAWWHDMELVGKAHWRLED